MPDQLQRELGGSIRGLSGELITSCWAAAASCVRWCSMPTRSCRPADELRRRRWRPSCYVTRHGSAAALVLLWAALVLKDAADPSDLPFLR